MNRFLKTILLVVTVALVPFVTIVSTGCKPKKVVVPPPPPTPTPVLPPGSVVFVERGHLVRMDLDSSQVTPLTSGKTTEWFPACSPKESQVAFWSNAEGGIYNLWKINLDGSNRLQLTFDEVNALDTGEQNLLLNDSPAWSFDGKKIVYSLAGDIWQIDSDGFNPETLLTGHKAYCPSYSPKGDSILFITMDSDPVYNLWSMSLSDRTLKKLTTYTDWNVGSPSYSADGNKIIFNLYRSNETQVYTASADGSNPVALTNTDRSLCPRFAQNDRKIIFCTYGTGDDIGLTLFLANINASDAKALPAENAASPSWAPSLMAAATAPVSTVPVSTTAGAPVSASGTMPSISLPTPVGK